MSNRRLTAQARRMRSYRNAGSGPAIHTDARGRVRRGEGRNNFGYGPLTGSVGVLTLHKQAERRRKVYGATPHTVADLEAMTRDELRALAKERGLSGYGKLNKAGLVEVLS